MRCSSDASLVGVVGSVSGRAAACLALLARFLNVRKKKSFSLSHDALAPGPVGPSPTRSTPKELHSMAQYQ